MTGEVDVPEEAVELLAERNAIRELWGWWEDTPSREAKEGRQRQRYAQLSEGVKDSWRKGAREQLALVAPSIRSQERQRVREALGNKLWLYRCPHHGLIDGGHYRDQEWVAEDGCPLLCADEETCGQEVERFDVLTLTARLDCERCGGRGVEDVIWRDEMGEVPCKLCFPPLDSHNVRPDSNTDEEAGR